jgi:hypothetical protein
MAGSTRLMAQTLQGLLRTLAKLDRVRLLGT